MTREPVASHPTPEDSPDALNAALGPLADRTDKPQPAYVPSSTPTPITHPTPPTGFAAEGAWPDDPSGLLNESDATEPLAPDTPDDPDEHTLVRVRAPTENAFAIEAVAGPAFGHVVAMSRRPLVVGRALGGLQVDDPFVSEAHASFFVRNDEPIVADGGAPSGVFVEVGRRVALSQGDVFACGLQVFRFLGAVEPIPAHGTYGAPLPFKAYRLEHVLVGGRSGRVVVFRHAASVGRCQGSLQFPDDELLDDLHVELKAGPHGMALVTHSKRWPAFMRIPTGAEVALAEGTLVRIGTSTLKVVLG